jgi:hypothetical protein
MRPILLLLSLLLLPACAGPQTAPASVPAFSSFHADLAMANQARLPQAYRETKLGFVMNEAEFESFWSALTLPPETPAARPAVDFSRQFVLFIRNTEYYNRIRIGTVRVIDREAEPLAMETLSARPVTDKAAIAFVVLERESVTAIRFGKERIAVPN